MPPRPSFTRRPTLRQPSWRWTRAPARSRRWWTTSRTAGVSRVVQMAHWMGITSTGRDFTPVCAITLGSVGFTPLELTDVYATIASGGIHHAPQAFETVRGPNSKILGKISTTGREVLAPNLAAELTYAMEQVITSGTGVAANIGRPAAGKTGTAENYQDAWFCGFVPQRATCVWVGY